MLLRSLPLEARIGRAEGCEAERLSAAKASLPDAAAGKRGTKRAA